VLGYLGNFLGFGAGGDNADNVGSFSAKAILFDCAMGLPRV